MWYDILVVCILLYFLAKGAARGLIWQLAGIAGILLCITFAGTASRLIGPHINLDPPANQWAVMFITYLLASFVAFGFARTLNQWIEKLELKEYNRHLGAIFGLLKGALLVLVMTFMIVTFSERSRDSVRDSKAAHYAAMAIHQLEPVIPDKLNAAVSRYIDMFERTNFVNEAMAQNGEVLPDELGSEPAPANGAELGQSAPFDPANPFDTRRPDSPSSSSSQREVPPDLLHHLQATLGFKVTNMVLQELENASPQIRDRIERSVTDALQSADNRSKRQLQEQVLNQGAPGNLVQLLDNWAADFLSSEILPAPRTTPTTPNSYSRQSPSATQPNNRVATPAPVNRQPAKPVTSNQPAGARTILDEIVSTKSEFPSIQKTLKAEYEQILRELPQQVGQAVFTDWYGDLTNSRTDVDPDTSASTPLEARIQRQLKKANFPVERLPEAMQRRLENFGLTSEGAGVFR